MDTEELVEREPEQEPAGGSILADLRATRARIARERPHTRSFDVPGYGSPSALAVVYRYPETGYGSIVAAAEREAASRAPDARLNSNADILIAACGSVIGRRDGKPLDLRTDEALDEDEIPGRPLRFNLELAELLGLEVPPEVKSKARFVVRHVFSPGAAVNGRFEGDVALIGQANRLYAWLAGVSRQIDDDFVGE